MPSPFKMQEEELIQAMQPMEHISELKLDDVAARLLLSKRSLQRRLHQRGTNWTAFKRKCQLSLARTAFGRDQSERFRGGREVRFWQLRLFHEGVSLGHGLFSHGLAGNQGLKPNGRPEASRSPRPSKAHAAKTVQSAPHRRARELGAGQIHAAGDEHQPTESHGPMDACEQHGLGHHGVARTDELRQKGKIKNRGPWD